ncbi:MAG: hypothetical protein U0840_31255 [Gemmataceae bacterium]
MPARPTPPAPATDGSIFESPADLMRRLGPDLEMAGEAVREDPEMVGAIGATMFDLPGSEDNTITVLLPQGNTQSAPSQTLVRIKSRSDGDRRSYLGIVTAGPFAEPDSLRGDSHMLVTVATRRGSSWPYHGRVQVSILGEELPDGSLTPPRLRPLPNSPVFAAQATRSRHGCCAAAGDIRLGLVVEGHASVAVGVPSRIRRQCYRATPPSLGTTGGGKSTTVARLVQQAQAAGDGGNPARRGRRVRNCISRPTTRACSRAAGAGPARGRGAGGCMTLYHLVGRDTANPDHPCVRAFSLQFARLSPYAAMEILGLSEAAGAIPEGVRHLQGTDARAGHLPPKKFAPPRRGKTARPPHGTRRVRAWLPAHDTVAADRRRHRLPAPRTTKSGSGAKKSEEEPAEEFHPYTPILASGEGGLLWGRRSMPATCRATRSRGGRSWDGYGGYTG